MPICTHLHDDDGPLTALDARERPPLQQISACRGIPFLGKKILYQSIGFAELVFEVALARSRQSVKVCGELFNDLILRLKAGVRPAVELTIQNGQQTANDGQIGVLAFTSAGKMLMNFSRWNSAC